MKTARRSISVAHAGSTGRAVAAAHTATAAQLRAQVERLEDELRRAQGLATLGTMTAMVAHEFNNILTPIVNYAQLAAGNPELVTKALTDAADGGRRASIICDAILGVARGAPDRLEEIPLGPLVEQTLSAMARDPRRDLIHVTIAIPEGLTVVARRAELQQVLLNLLLNARQAVLARSAPRRIEVRAESVGGRLRLTIRDNGVGIGPKNLPRIFEPFFTTRPSGGTGLGLAFCQRIVRAQGGHLTARSRPGAGATFTVVLPAECPAVVAPAAAS